MDLAENRFRKTWERFLEVLKVDCHGKRLRDSILSLFFLFLYLGYKNESLWIWQKIDLEKPGNVSLKY